MVGEVLLAPGLTSMTSRLKARLLAQRSLFQRLQNSKKRSKLQAGFTLIELLIVVIIIGVLSSIALPAFLNQQGRARISSAQGAVMSAARSCAAAQITGDEDFYEAPPNVEGDCGEAGTGGDFTSVGFTGDNGTEAVATLSDAGGVSLTTCAATAGWDAGEPETGCVPERSS
jgi:type IV pilus assembly protein PilA